MTLSFDPTIKLSDILTSLSFILAVLALLYSQQKDRGSVEKERVAEIRSILSTNLIKLERWGELSGAVFDDMQPVIITVTEIWAEKGDTIKARDYLWREMNNIFSLARKNAREEKVAGTYIELYRINRKLPERYKNVLEQLNNLSTLKEEALLIKTQQVVLSYNQREGARISAKMGNDLRSVASLQRDEFREKFAQIIRPLESEITSSLSKKDADLQAELQTND